MDSKINNMASAVVPVKKAVSASKPMAANFVAVITLVVIDLLAISISIIIAFILRDNILPLLSPALFTDKLLDHTFQLLWWYPFAFIFCLAYEKLYYKRLPFWIEVESIIKACTLAFFIAVAFIYIFGMSDIISRAIVIMIWVLALFLIPTLRYYGKKTLFKLNIWNCPVILIGDMESATLLTGALTREETMGYDLIGRIDIQEKQEEKADLRTGCRELTSLGSLDQTEKIIKDTGVQDVIVSVKGMPSGNLVSLANRFQSVVNNLIIVPDLFGISLNGIDVAYLFEEQTLLLQIKNRLKSPFSRAIKRLFDMTAGLIIFILSSPVILVISLAVKLDSPGSVYFVKKRIGQKGQEFLAYKFRTMYQEADQILEKYLADNDQARHEWQEYQKLKAYDPRVTKVGRLLRKYSLDELPQLFNVLKGEMSLVGPRPYLPREREQIGSYAEDIHITKPGLTGLWQVSGRNNLSFESRLKLDSWYVKNWSLWLDAVMLLKTVRVIMKSDGAY